MQHKRDNYKFIIAGNGGGLYDYVYRDVNDLPYAAYDHGLALNPLCKALMRVHLSSRINRIVPLPFRGVWGALWVRQWGKKLEAMHLSDRTPCFILFADMIPFERFGLSRTIRKTFPQAKIVYFYQDLVALDRNKLDLIRKKTADLIFSFDCGDAEKYRLLVHNFPYSKWREKLQGGTPEYDVCFIGKAKDRLPQILEAYRYFTAQGLRCSFSITGVPAEQQQYAGQICYCDGMPYSAYLDKISRAKCILEIMQGGGSGNTLRINEAVEFNKILITDNAHIRSNTLYDSRYMFSYGKIQEINCDTLRRIQDVRYENREQMSVETFLEDVAKALEADRADSGPET